MPEQILENCSPKGTAILLRTFLPCIVLYSFYPPPLGSAREHSDATADFCHAMKSTELTHSTGTFSTTRAIVMRRKWLTLRH